MKSILQKVCGYDRMVNGLLIGMLIPPAAFALIFLLFNSIGILQNSSNDQTVHILRPRTIGLLCIAINVVFLNQFNKMRWYESMRGITISTFAIIVLWLIKFYKEIW